MNSTYILVAVLLSALCTLFWRFLPFLMIGKGKVPAVVKYLGKTLPPAIMALLIVYCLKDAVMSFSMVTVYKIIAVLVCAALQLWKKNSMLSIISGTALYMILLNVFV